MNIASALIKKIIELQDFETWTSVRKNYLPLEYHSLFGIIEHHSSKYHKIPTFDDLKYEVRDAGVREKLYAIEAIEVDSDAFMLLEYLKNEYTQKEILGSLELYIDSSVAFEDAEESVEHLHQIVLDIEDKVDLEPPQESMQRIPLFEDEEEIANYTPLGLNADYDYEISFAPTDLILVGGKRGAGKSIVCANVANNTYESGKSAIYFTIEMDSKSILQRCCSIATGVPFSRLRKKTLGVTEWQKVASWWANRFGDSESYYKEFEEHNNFDLFHKNLTSNCELLPTQQLHVVYDPSLTLAKIESELDKRARSMNTGIIIVDYINQVKRSSMPSRGGQYDWTEQIEVSKALKTMAQEYRVPILSPYQTDNSGEARFAKGILDAADAAYALNPHEQEDECFSLKCVKMRNAPMNSFTSQMDWNTLKIGPESAIVPTGDSSDKVSESVDDKV